MTSVPDGTLVCAAAPTTTTDGGLADGDAATITDAGTIADGDAAAIVDTGSDAVTPDGSADAAPASTMSFFVTSVGVPAATGANFGGIGGGDSHCTSLVNASTASAAVKAKTWRAYLSVAASLSDAGVVVNAKDRIGVGPWHNFNGALVGSAVATLHASGIPSALMVTELGTTIASTERDVVTGSTSAGLADPDPTWSSFGFTAGNCANWTNQNAFAFTMVGHTDWDLGPFDAGVAASWNAAHRAACTLIASSDSTPVRRLYCFAAD